MSGPPGQYPPPIGGKAGTPSGGQRPPPGQYPPSGAPGQYPPPGVQYPAPGAPGQYPPPSAPPGQYPPPGAPGYYPPPGAPGQYPPPGAPGQYPPPGAPGQYPPPGAPGQYPPPGAPGQYPPPGAPGQYPPPGAPGQYPPPGAPGQYPPPGAPGQYPPPGGAYPAPGGGHYPPPGQFPPGGHGPPGQFPPGGHSGGLGPNGQDTVDSDGENFLHTVHSKHPVSVKFVNRTNQKVLLYWISEKGKFKKITKIKQGHSEDVDTFETHPFVADAKKGADVVIDGNIAFLPQKAPGSHASVRAEITPGPRDRKSLRSPQSGAPVTLKFSNRSHNYVTVKWINPNGQAQKIKDIAPKKAWLFNSCEGHYFIASERGHDEEEMDLNFGWFYLAKRGGNPQSVKKVIITEPVDNSSSSSSSSD